MIAPDLQQEIEQFLYREVRLLSEGKYAAWLDLLTDDVHYWMPARETTADLADSVTKDGLAIFEDDKAFLEARVARLSSGLAHAEQPPSRVRYFVTNVEIEPLDTGEHKVHCNLLIYQSRLERSECFFVGRREDRLRRVDGDWKIAHRMIVLDQALVPRSISIFF